MRGRVSYAVGWVARKIARAPKWWLTHPAELISVTLLVIITLGTLDAYITR